MEILLDKFSYQNREERIDYLFNNYSPYLAGSVLDIGCDRKLLKKYLRPEQYYVGIDIGGEPDIRLNLEKAKIPFPENSFDTIVCLDVLEHLDNLHDVMDQLIGLSKKHLIISLPNCWGSLKSSFLNLETPKFYGLPPAAPEDRHKWFFNVDDAKNFAGTLADEKKLRLKELKVLIHQPRGVKGLAALVVRSTSKRYYYNFFGQAVWLVFEKN